MSRELCGAIGNRGIDILGPFVGLSHIRVSDRCACAMTGAFHALPTELIQCIVACLLASRRDPLASARDVRDFVCTCRGAAAAVAREVRLEAAARAYMGGTLTPPPEAPPHRAYTELLYTFMRSHLAYQAMMQTLRDAQSHCAHQVCCSAGRKHDNALWSDEDWWLPWGEVGRALLEGALGKAAHPAMRVTVAAATGATLLCQTERGAAFAQQRPLCPASSLGVLCVESEPCDVYTPDRELKVAFMAPTDRFVALAASSGRWLAVITCPSILADEEVAQPWAGSEHMRRFVNESVLQVWDMEANECVFAREADAIVHRLWMVGPTVYWFARGYDSVGQSLRPVRVACCAWMDATTDVYSLGSCGFLDSSSVARHTGDLAFFDARREQGPDFLNFFDATLKQVRTVDTYDDRRHGPSQALRNMVGLSPTGDVMVALLRGNGCPGTVIYRRSFDALTDWKKCRRLGWRPWKHLYPSCDAEFPRRHDYAHQHGVFSPCGSKAVFFFKGGQRGEVVTVDMRGAIGGGDSPEVRITVEQVYHQTLPQDAVAWVDGGIYLPTAACGGLLRIGTS